MLACVILGFAALLGAGGVAVRTVEQAQDHAAWVQHTYDVERRISALRVLIERLEVSRRGYLLAHRPEMRRTFVETAGAEAPLIRDIRRLTADNPLQQHRADLIQRLTQEHFRILLGSMIEADRDPAAARKTFEIDQSRALTRQLRDVAAGMLGTENDLLAVRVTAQQESVQALLGVLAVAGMLVVVVAIFSVAVLRRYTRGLVVSRDAVATLNAELESRVRERTRDLSRANEEIQRFAYIVSHDLRSPLVNVMGFTGELEAAAKPLGALVDRVEAEAPDLLEKEAVIAVREDLPEAIGFIRTSTEKMDRLINSILRLSREGKRVLTPERLDLVAMVDGIAASLQHRIDAIGATIVVQRLMPTLVADRLAVEQMLSNLIENAVKYLKPGRSGRIVIDARSDRGRVAIEVADNGRGIDPRDHDRIFDLFRRSGMQDQPGEGIGLAHVRALAYRLGGLVDCRSTIDAGATFTLSLPAQPPASQG